MFTKISLWQIHTTKYRNTQIFTRRKTEHNAIYNQGVSASDFAEVSKFLCERDYCCSQFVIATVHVSWSRHKYQCFIPSLLRGLETKFCRLKLTDFRYKCVAGYFDPYTTFYITCVFANHFFFLVDRNFLFASFGFCFWALAIVSVR